ncbi:MAG: 2Fe-2S iron-sulfur cluster-binding protein [Synechococcales bacterium]|nr:2Fe-2S iron-sulfur cluster-binding protein [Synechococcales bacterium]
MATTYQAEIHHQGQVLKIDLPDDRPILETANALGLELPISCASGVCTTCAALITEGKVEQVDNLGISAELQQQGYALLCVAYPRSNLKIETQKEETVYQLQFGQYQNK